MFKIKNGQRLLVENGKMTGVKPVAGLVWKLGVNFSARLGRCHRGANLTEKINHNVWILFGFFINPWIEFSNGQIFLLLDLIIRCDIILWIEKAVYKHIENNFVFKVELLVV